MMEITAVPRAIPIPVATTSATPSPILPANCLRGIRKDKAAPPSPMSNNGPLGGLKQTLMPEHAEFWLTHSTPPLHHASASGCSVMSHSDDRLCWRAVVTGSHTTCPVGGNPDRWRWTTACVSEVPPHPPLCPTPCIADAVPQSTAMALGLTLSPALRYRGVPPRAAKAAAPARLRAVIETCPATWTSKGHMDVLGILLTY
eukprot:gene6402-6184_t